MSKKRLMDNMTLCSFMRECGYFGAKIDNAAGDITISIGRYLHHFKWTAPNTYELSIRVDEALVQRHSNVPINKALTFIKK